MKTALGEFAIPPRVYNGRKFKAMSAMDDQKLAGSTSQVDCYSLVSRSIRETIRPNRAITAGGSAKVRR
jgi:hypothetical protein